MGDAEGMREGGRAGEKLGNPQTLSPSWSSLWGNSARLHSLGFFLRLTAFIIPALFSPVVARHKARPGGPKQVKIKSFRTIPLIELRMMDRTAHHIHLSGNGRAGTAYAV
jgi:hypothetical protein